jgi:thioredoxin-like negative regulator of GroEL
MTLRSPLRKALTLAWLALAGAPLAAAEPVWHDRVDRAFEAAKASGKNVLVDLYAEWCGWCKVMEKDVFTTPAFQSFAEQFVLLRVDVEDGGEGAALQSRFRAESLPTLLLLDPKRAYVGQVQGFYPTDRLIGRIKAELTKHELSIRSYEKALAGTDPAAWERKAFDLHQKGDGTRAAALFEKLVALPEPDAQKGAWRRFLLADSYRIAEDLTRAQTALAEAAKAATAVNDAKLVERVEWLGFAIARDAHDCAGAQGALARFEKQHPASPLLAEVRRDWTSLKTAAQCS